MGLDRTALIFAVGVVLAFLWGVYYVFVTAAGFEMYPTIELLAVTAVAAAGLVGMELHARRKRRAP